MRVSISNIAWDSSLDLQMSSILNRFGIDAIDIAPTKYFPNISNANVMQLDTVRNWWNSRGIEIIGMQSLLYGYNGLNLFAGPDVQQRMLDHLKDVCRIGDRLNARLLVFGSPRNRDRSGFTDQQAFEMATLFFKRLALVAERYSVTICLEPNPSCYGSNFMTSSLETLAIVNAVDHPSIRFQFDTGALLINEESPTMICEKYRNLIGHVHVSEPQLLPVGTASTDHRVIASALKEFLPNAPVTIEMLTNGDPDSIATIESSLEYVIKSYGSGSVIM
jgi:D-psicose/D-tagatose/L-ribulose 3-epimerase